MEFHFKGQCPFYEIWYGKLNIAPNEAFWFRYTLLNGKTKEAALWAIYFHPEKIIAQKKVYALSDLSFTQDVRLPSGLLNDTKTQGSLDRLQWNFIYENKGGSFDPVPFLFKFLHLSQSSTKTVASNAHFNGTLTIDGKSHSLYNVRGMMGHVWGKKQAQEWTWAHCNTFPEEGVIFEGLSARIHHHLKPLTSLYLKYNGKEYFFNSAIDLFKTHTRFGYTFWHFSAHHKDISIKGTVQSIPQKIAVVTYTDTDNSHLYCHNSKLATLELSLIDHKTKEKKSLVSESAALEWVTREEPSGDILL